MGERGIGSKLMPLPGEDTNLGPHIWEADGLSRVERVIAFLENLPVTSGLLAGQKMRLLPEQRQFIEDVYGPADENGRRIVRVALLSEGKKNGKTGLLAALALCHLCGPEEELRGEVYSAAASRDQASLIFDEMVAVIRSTLWMRKRLSVKRFNRLIEDRATGTIYKSLCSDDRVAHGPKPSVVICDELAQWRSRKLYDALRQAGSSRAEPLVFVISTMSEDTMHPMGELVEYAEKINAGVVKDPAFVGHIYTVPEDDDIWDEANWYKANPALGIFKSLEDMRFLARQAQEISTYEPSFRNLHMNQPIEGVGKFVSPADWKKCLDDVDARALEGRECYAGLDLSERRDLTALVLVFPDSDDSFDVLSWFWLPKEGLLDREHVDRAPYSTWLQQEHLEVTDGKSIHYGSVVRRLAEVSERFNILEVAYDRWNMERLSQAMSEIGLDLPVRAFGQGFRDMSPAVDVLEGAVINERLRSENPVLTMCALNAVVQTDPAGNRKLAKDRSTGRIDGAVALAMALRRATEFANEDHGIRLPENYVVTIL